MVDDEETLSERGGTRQRERDEKSVNELEKRLSRWSRAGRTSKSSSCRGPPKRTSRQDLERRGERPCSSSRYEGRTGERRCGRGRGGSSKSRRRRSMPSFARARWPATQPRSQYVSTSLRALHFSVQHREGRDAQVVRSAASDSNRGSVRWKGAQLVKGPKSC